MFDDFGTADEHDEFGALVEKLVADERELGLADQAIAIGLEEAVKALREGVS